MEKNQKPAPPTSLEMPEPIHWVALVFLSLVWGSSFILIKKGLEAFPYDQVGALRVAWAYVVLLPVALFNLRKVPKGKWKYIVLMGLLGNFIPAFFFAKAQTQIPSSITGVLNALTPILTLVLGVVVFRNVLNRRQLLGLVIGFFGCIILTLMNSSGTFGGINLYIFFIIGATVCYAFNANLIKKYLTSIRALRLTSLAMFPIGPLALGYLFSTDFPQRLQEVEGAWEALGYLAILGIMGTAVALVVFNKVIQKTSAVFASSVTYIIPVVAVTWGILDGEKLFLGHYIGMATILAGVFITNRK